MVPLVTISVILADVANPAAGATPYSCQTVLAVTALGVVEAGCHLFALAGNAVTVVLTDRVIGAGLDTVCIISITFEGPAAMGGRFTAAVILAFTGII